MSRRQAHRAHVREHLANWKKYRRIPLKKKRSLDWLMQHLYRADSEDFFAELLCPRPLLTSLTGSFVVPERSFS